MFKKFIMVLGFLTLLWILSTQFELKDQSPDRPRVINPSDFAPPKVEVRR